MIVSYCLSHLALSGGTHAGTESLPSGMYNETQTCQPQANDICHRDKANQGGLQIRLL